MTVAAMALRWLPVEAWVQYKLFVGPPSTGEKSYITSLLQPITACPRSMVLRLATDYELFTP